MSTGAQNPKRARTIDAFFAPKQPKNVVGVELPHRGAAAVLRAGMDSGSGAAGGKGEAQGPAPQAQQPCGAASGAAEAQKAVPAAAAAAAEGASPRQSPRVAGRKRRGRPENDPESQHGDPAAGATTDAEAATAAAAPQPQPQPLGLLQGRAADPPSGEGAEGEGARAEAAAAAGATSCAVSGPASAGATSGQPLGGAAPASADDGLTPAQRAQVVANRNRALARRAVADASASSSACGSKQPPLSSLLVEPSWREALAGELAGANLRQLEAFLHGEWGAGRKAVFPPKDCVFQAFNACPFDQVRVVILGQDPYHGPGQAMGLSFSVPRDCRPLPPSLLNIYKEAAADLGWADRPDHGDLTAWSVQGVLLLNTCLTVRQGEANSHSKRGWEQFTDAAIRSLSSRRSGLVFLLWGNPAQAKASLIDGRKHHVLKAAHPSPLSASRGFFGCRHFSKANQLLAGQGLAPIEWRPT